VPRANVKWRNHGEIMEVLDHLTGLMSSEGIMEAAYGPEVLYACTCL
jgi:hypothetical protein